MLVVEEQGDGWITTQLVRAHKCFKTNRFKRYIKTLANIKGVTTTNTTKFTEDGGLDAGPVRDCSVKTYGRDTLDVKDVARVLLKQKNVAKKMALRFFRNEETVFQENLTHV